MKTFTQRANAGTNITLLSICDLAALRPPSECSLTMGKGEGGSSLHYSVIHWRYTSSRTGDSIQTRKEWANPVPVCSAQESCDGSASSLLHQIGHENFEKRQNKHLESLQTLHGAGERTFPSPSLSLHYPEKFRGWSHVSRPHTNNSRSRSTPYQHGSVFLCSSRRLTLSAALQNISFWQSPEARRADRRRQVSVTEQSFSSAHFIKQNFGPSFSPVALWETSPSFVPLIQFDTDCTAAADICTFTDFSMIWLQKQTSVKWRCKIFIEIYKLEGNKKNFRPDTL